MASTSSDIPKIDLFYHPRCSASSKLMTKIGNNPEAEKLFNFINIASLNGIPPGVKRIPCLNYDSRMVHGKECFELMERLVSGPTSCNIFNRGSTVCSFSPESTTEYQISPNFSSIDGDPNNMDGFKGVPVYTGNENVGRR